MTFRKTFRFPLQVNWYPGHMRKSMDQLRSRYLPLTDVLIEIRDSRLPLSCCNPQFDYLIKEQFEKNGKYIPKIVFYNKTDLLSGNELAKLENFVSKYQNGSNSITNYEIGLVGAGSATSHHKIFGKRFITTIKDTILTPDDYYQQSPKLNTPIASRDDNIDIDQDIEYRAMGVDEIETNVMGLQTKNNGQNNSDGINSSCDNDRDELDEQEIDKGRLINKTKAISGDHAMIAIMGYPNVGKSTIINTLRKFCYKKSNSATTSKNAGFTKNISYFKLLGKPKPMYLVDTPGIFVPSLNVVSNETFYDNNDGDNNEDDDDDDDNDQRQIVIPQSQQLEQKKKKIKKKRKKSCKMNEKKKYKNVKLTELDIKHGISIETAMKLGIAGCISDHIIGPYELADYLLFLLNKKENFSYLKQNCCNMKQPSDNIDIVLRNIAYNPKYQKKHLIENRDYYQSANNELFDEVDFDQFRTSQLFLEMYRQGKLDRSLLDDIDCFDNLNSNNQSEHSMPNNKSSGLLF